MKEEFGLYLIATNPVVGYEKLAQIAVHCGVRYLQLRMKNAPHETILKTAHQYREITQGTFTRFIMNDDLSIAMEVDADGVHLGQSDLSLSDARQKWNTPGKLFGLSTHSMEQAKLATKLSPDYIGIGPVYPTPTKPDAAPALGPKETGRIAQTSTMTSVAIGGINTTNLRSLFDSGVRNFCVVSAVNNHPNPEAPIRAFQQMQENPSF